MFRDILQVGLLFRLFWIGYKLEVRGRNNLRIVNRPCLVISNHCMHLDWSMLLRTLPFRFRRRTAVAAAADDIYGNRLRGFTSSLLGNSFAFDTGGSGTRESLEAVLALLESRYSVILFPEGELTTDGPMKPFKAGAGWIAQKSGVDVLPIRIDVVRKGIFEGRWRWWPRGHVRVTVGPPIRVPAELSYDETARLLQQAVVDA
ncbi:MAG TPA: lysophospholipid acyltransferase family protein [Tepidiformaceae bacterium]|nr:lysophospholipid acyltransferase family protein [Tepidiformaceae bacterium]